MTAAVTVTVGGLLAIVVALLAVHGLLKVAERRRRWRVVEIRPDGGETVLLFGYRTEEGAQAGADILGRINRAAQGRLRYEPRRVVGGRR